MVKVADGAAFCPHCAAPLPSRVTPAPPAAALPVHGVSAPAVPAPISGMASCSLYVSLFGVVLTCLLGPGGAILALAGLTLGILSLNETRREPGVRGKGMAIIGLVVGALGLVAAVLVIAGVDLQGWLGLRPRVIFGIFDNSLQ